MLQFEEIKRQLAFLGAHFVDELLKQSQIIVFPKDTQILRKEQYVKVLPIVITGLVKVLSSFHEKDLLLYYIQPNQSCVMSFAAALKNTPSKVFAITEEETQILLLPVDKLSSWMKINPKLNDLFFNQYDQRYSDLLDTIQHILVNKMDKRLLDYLKLKSSLSKSNALKMSHSKIASELGTAREVVSRVIKKLEIEGNIIQDAEGIKISE